MKKISIFLLICIMVAVFAACAKRSSAQNFADGISESESVSGQNTAQSETFKEQRETETQIETETTTDDPEEYELNTVESLEDDGKEMSAAESLRSAMNGKHSVLELTYRERLFSLTDGDGWQQADEIKDMADAGLARINMLTYNRGVGLAIMPIAKAGWKYFVCVDLDQNGTKEVLVHGTSGGAVLHYSEGEVYMTVINERSFPNDIYENGIYRRDGGGVGCTAYDRLYPAKGAMYCRIMAYNSDNEGLITPPVYKVMNKAVTKEEYDAYLKDLIGGLTPLEWHEFTEENIDKYVVD